MELAGDLSEDRNAGYIDDNESDIEYSENEDWDVDSSDEEGKWEYLHKKVMMGSSGLRDEYEEFEKKLDKELVTALTEYINSLDDGDGALQGEAGTSSDALTNTAPVVSEVGDSLLDDEAKEDKDSATAPSLPADCKKTDTEFYDDVYFSSGSSDGEESTEISGEMDDSSKDGVVERKKHKQKVRKLTNDELFYDPDMDNADERWMKRQRMAYHNVREPQRPRHQKETSSALGSAAVSDGNTTSSVKLPKSDAILSCPACLSTLCIDCQRHTFYKNQYRAMFVLNCTIMRNEVLKENCVKESKKSKKKRKRQTPKEDDSEGVGPYHPVRCTICNTEVGVYDSEEVFHFFNVVPSAS